jgi:dihydrodipicolinate synthase/N-acetylneuraminate lyase
MNPKIKGVIVPPITPFNAQGGIDPTAIKRLVNFLIERGIHGLFPGGTTGEGPLLSISERRQLAETFVAAADGRVPVIIHTGAITTADTVDLTRHAQTIGAQAAAILPPYYYHHRDEVLQHHFETVARQVPDFPLYLYNNPPVTCNNLSTPLVMQLLERCPNIIGMKESSTALDTLFAISSLRNGAFNTASGSDGQILVGMAMGFDACVSGNANVVPELVVALYHAASQGNLVLARELQRKLDGVRQILKDGADLSLFKGILVQRGLAVGSVRPPLLPASEATIAQCWQALAALDLEFIPA